MISLSKIVVSTNKFIRKNYSCFKLLHQNDNDQLLSESTMFISFYQKKISKNEMVKQIAASINRSSRQDFLKAAVRNRSMKRAIISFSCRAPCS